MLLLLMLKLFHGVGAVNGAVFAVAFCRCCFQGVVVLCVVMVRVVYLLMCDVVFRSRCGCVVLLLVFIVLFPASFLGHDVVLVVVFTVWLLHSVVGRDMVFLLHDHDVVVVPF